MTFLPLAILLLIDTILITLTVIDKLHERYRRRHIKGKPISKAAFLAKGAGRFRQNRYEEITDSPPMASDRFITQDQDQDQDLEMMEPRINNLRRRPTGFEQLGTLEADFMVREQLQEEQGEQKTDLHLFVQSLSKCLGATKFGLSFEFRDLGFKAPTGKVILSQVSGTINAGSLWGVMGASGAGKCEFLMKWGGRRANVE